MAFGTEQGLSTAVAADEHGTEGVAVQLLPVQKQLQIFMRGSRIADLELDRLTGPYHGTDGNRPIGLVGTKNGTDQKIATAEMITMFVNDESDQESVLKQFTFMLRQ